MIKSVVVHDIPMSHIAAMERWYYTQHSAEIARRYGPWLQRHESWLPVDAPADARAFGFFNWRVTEAYWREIPERGAKGTFAFTVPPVIPTVAACFVPPQPTEDFLGGEIQPGEKNALRWYILIRYPDGVSKKDGEDWFLNVHAKEVARQPGLYRFFSTSTIKEHIILPGTWPPKDLPRILATLETGWDRVIELWYDNFDDWRRAVIETPPAYTKPAWARYDRYPFLEPGVDFVSSFLLERPNDEFLRDSRLYV